MKKLSASGMKSIKGGMSECDQMLTLADLFGLDRKDLLRKMSFEQLMGCTIQ